MGWIKDAPDHYSRRLRDGRYLSAWPQRGHWRWEVLAGDTDATVNVEGTADSLKLAKAAAEHAAKPAAPGGEQ